MAKEVVWMGLDYSLMRLVGDTNGFKVPDLLFQNMPERWNDLFLDERLEGVADALDTRMSIDIAAVSKHNKNLNRSQIVLNAQKDKFEVNETHISSEDINKLVQSLETDHKDGVGLIFIVDRFVSQALVYPSPGGGNKSGMITTRRNAGDIYVVFFDIATRRVISADREIRPVATGGSFRNYWFGPVKEVDRDIGKFRNSIASHP